MDESREIWIVRHGETAWSKSGQHTGRSDLPLTEKGREEAGAARDLLKGRKFSAVLCSPLVRAVTTCEIAGYRDQAELEPLVMEWDYGELNGLTRAQVRDRLGADWNIWKGPVPGGETLQQVGDRAAAVMRKIEKVDGDVLIFAHGHFLRIFTATYLGMEPGAARHFALATASAGILGAENGYPALKAWNVRS